METRDAAFESSTSEVDRGPAYSPPGPQRVKAVTACPQPTGHPLVAVFVTGEQEPEGAASRTGHFLLFNVEGEQVDFQDHNDWLNGHLADLNGDGVMEHVDSYQLSSSGVSVQALVVTKMVPPFDETFTVLWTDEGWGWRLLQPDPTIRPKLQLFEGEGSQLASRAEFVWSSDQARWLGPAGSREAGFIVAGKDLDAAALAIADPECGLFAEHVAEELPEVKRTFAEAGEGARPGSLYHPVEEGDFAVALGFHHDHRFETVFLVEVQSGELVVTQGGAPLDIPPEAAHKVRQVCNAH